MKPVQENMVTRKAQIVRLNQIKTKLYHLHALRILVGEMSKQT